MKYRYPEERTYVILCNTLSLALVHLFCTVVLQHSTYLFYINASLHKSMQIHEEQALCYCLTRLSYLFSSKIALLRWKENLLISSKYIILISANSSSLKLAYLLCYFNLPSDFWCSLVTRSVRFFFWKQGKIFVIDCCPSVFYSCPSSLPSPPLRGK